MDRKLWVNVLLVASGLWVGGATGCTVREEADAGLDGGRDAPRADVPLSDAGRDTGPSDAMPEDAVSIDAPPIDGGLEDGGLEDGGLSDTGLSDTGFSDAGLSDAGTDAPVDAAGLDAPIIVPPTIDGVITAGEWASASTAVDVTTTVWDGNELRGLRVLVADGALYLALEGRIEGGNAMAVYVDRNLDETDGVVSLASLTDNSGALDAAITASLSTPAGFRTDMVFGTLDLSRAAGTSDERMGWRDLVRASSVDDLYWVTSPTAPVVCSATACETRLPLSELGGTSPRRMGFFARIVSPDGSMSPNQTLPSDDPSMPRTVSVVLELSE